MSKETVSEIRARLRADYQEFCKRNLDEYEINCLFVDDIAERLCPGQKRKPVLAAWVIAMDGKKILLGLLAGSEEDAETVSVFFQELLARGLGDLLLVVSDGATGIIKAIETCFPRSPRQQCLAHGLLNLAAKVREDQWPHFKADAQASCQASSRVIARDLAEGAVNDYENELSSAILLAGRLRDLHWHLRLQVTHRRPIRTTNLLKRLIVEEGRRLKIIPNAFNEKPVLKLTVGAMIRAAERWRAMKITTFERRQLAPCAKSSITITRPATASTQAVQPPILKPEFPAILGLDP